MLAGQKHQLAESFLPIFALPLITIRFLDGEAHAPHIVSYKKLPNGVALLAG